MLSDTIAAERVNRDAAAAARESNIKSVLFHVHENDRLEQRLQVALSIARACSAHLQLLNVVPVEAFTIVDTYGGTFISADIVEALEEQAEKLQARLEERLSSEDVSWDYRRVTASLPAELFANAALSDLVVIGREPANDDFTRTVAGITSSFLCGSRTPLFIPGNSDTVPADVTGTALIAWNGSFEAANAVRACIGLLQLASDVRVIRYTEAKEGAFPSTRLLEYLSRHGIHAELDERAPRGDVASSVQTYAIACGASYILMGGYSHSRAGEFLLGGVTRDLLCECPVSLVMAH